MSVTHNGDSQKVLATVAATLYVFTNRNPEAIEIEKDFIVLGLTEAKWEAFRKHTTYGTF